MRDLNDLVAMARNNPKIYSGPSSLISPTNVPPVSPAAKAAVDEYYNKKPPEYKMKKGGFVPPFAKKGGSSHKMPNGKMMKNSAMSMGGTAAKKPNPFMEMIAKKKEGKAGEKAEKFAKGGGIRGKSGYVGMGKKENPTDGSSTAGENPKIQKRGLTEGRVIKMASGGSVGRADGIAQRGKTRGKMC